MNEDQSAVDASRSPSPKRGERRLRTVLGGVVGGVLVPGALIVGAVLGGQHLLSTGPTTKRHARKATARPVDVIHVSAGTSYTTVEAMGIVRPSRTVRLQAQVGGRIERVGDAFQPGGLLDTNDDVLHIDKTDHLLAQERTIAEAARATTALADATASVAQANATVAQRETAMAEARARIALEEGNQAIARRELEMLGGGPRGSDSDLVLRKPQLAIARAQLDAASADVLAAQASVASAEAGVARAKADIEVADLAVRRAALDIERTTLKAPFNAWVREQHVEVGAVITSQTQVATLIGSDAYWIEVTIPRSELRWLDLPPYDTPTAPDGRRRDLVDVRDEAGWGLTASREGRLVRLLGDLENEGRMARVLVEVLDPLHRDQPRAEQRVLIAGSYVSIAFRGRPVANVVALDRAYLRDGDVVWIVNDDDRLVVQSVDVAWRGRTQVLLNRGLSAGDRVVSSDLAAPVPGMALRVTVPTDPVPTDPVPTKPVPMEPMR